MKDAFGNKLSLGDQVIYSTKGGVGTIYVVGKISKFYRSKKDKSYSPDRVSVTVEKTTSNHTFNNDPLVYASNVVLFKD